MEIDDPSILFTEARVNCLDCQFLNRPNPTEDIFMCLKTLNNVKHELDEQIRCDGFEVIKMNWELNYIENYGNFM